MVTNCDWLRRAAVSNPNRCADDRFRFFYGEKKINADENEIGRQKKQKIKIKWVLGLLDFELGMPVSEWVSAGQINRKQIHYLYMCIQNERMNKVQINYTYTSPTLTTHRQQRRSAEKQFLFSLPFFYSHFHFFRGGAERTRGTTSFTAAEPNQLKAIEKCIPSLCETNDLISEIEISESKAGRRRGEWPLWDSEIRIYTQTHTKQTHRSIVGISVTSVGRMKHNFYEYSFMQQASPSIGRHTVQHTPVKSALTLQKNYGE